MTIYLSKVLSLQKSLQDLALILTLEIRVHQYLTVTIKENLPMRSTNISCLSYYKNATSK